MAHLRHAVRFGEGVRALIARDGWHLLEVGPGRALSGLARQAVTDDRLVVSSLAGSASGGSAATAMLEALGRLWLRGADVDWAGVNAGESRRRLALPTYPFEKTRYWVDPLVEEEPAPAPPSTAKIEAPERWFYLPEWRQTPPARFYARGARVADGANWLLFIGRDDFSARVQAQLASQIAGDRICTVEPGEAFASRGPQEYVVNPTRREDYDRLFAALDAAGRLPDAIAHLWEAAAPRSLTDDDAASAEDAQFRGFYSLIWLTQAWLRRRTPATASPAALKVVAGGIHQVTGAETLRPERATMLAACRVIPQEHPDIACCAIDIDIAAADATAVVGQVVDELVMQAPDQVVAYRGDRRWSPLYEPVALEKDVPGRVAIRQRGTYLIAGGLGAIGLALARHLARTASARLVLVARSPLPEPSSWNAWIQTHADGDATSVRIRAVRELEALGAEVLVIAADIADRTAMAAAVAQAAARFGTIDGVIHAAGVAGAGAIQAGRRDEGASVLVPVDRIDPDGCLVQFRPKMRGLFALEDALEGRALDFCFIVSSLSAVLGGLGYATYAAANCFMDAFVRRHNRRGGVRWLSANWDAWSFAAADGARSTALAQMTLTEPEGVDAFDRLLGAIGLEQVVISVANIYARGLLPKEKEPAKPESAGESASLHGGRTVYPRPAALIDRFEAPRTPLEKTIADIWQEVIGIDRVGRRDNFFELGGHSLLAVQVAARLEDALALQIPMRSVFDSATVADLASRIESVLDGWQGVPALAGGDGETEELEL